MLVLRCEVLDEFWPHKVRASLRAPRAWTWLWSGHESSLLSHSMARTNLLFIVLSKARVKTAGTRRLETADLTPGES